MVQAHLILLNILLLLNTGCARKNPHFFEFKEQTITTNFKTLALPMVKKLTISQTPTHNALSWQALQSKEYQAMHPKLEFVGYNLYRFTPSSFIPSKPLNEIPLTTPTFNDQFNKKHSNKIYCYMIKAVFMHQEELITGPGSRIITTHNFNKR